MAKTTGITAAALRLAAAIEEARQLLATLGDDDPRTMRAVIHALELAEPGSTTKMMADCGIALPTATHCTDSGEPLFSIEQIADALGASTDDVRRCANEISDLLDEPALTAAPSRIQ